MFLTNIILQKLNHIEIHFKELLKGSFISLFFKLLSILSSYILFAVLANKWGANAVGFFSTYWTILLILSIFSKLGFDTYLVKIIPEKIALKQDSKIIPLYFTIIKKVIVAVFIISILVLLLQYQIKLSFFSQINFSIYGLIISLLFYSLLSINRETLMAFKKITSYSLLQNGSIYFILIFVFLLFNFNYDFSTVISFSLLFTFLLLLFFSFYPVIKTLKPLAIEKEEKENDKNLIKKSFPMMLSNSLFLLMSWIDVLMLSILKTSYDVGVYNTTLKVATLITIGLMGVNSIAMPKFSELKNNNKNFKSIANKSVLISLAIALPIFLIIIIFPKNILQLFGNEFIIGVESLRILSLGFLFSVISGSVVPILNMTGGAKIVKNILLLAVVLNIILNLILIPIWGIKGAAIATSITTIFWNLLSLVYIYRKFKFIPIFIKIGK